MKFKTLLSFMGDAERLIETAADAVNSFFVTSNDLVLGANPYTGFIRDSLLNERSFQITTGGGSVAANLYKVEQYLPYLKANRRIPIKTLLDNREKARSFIMDETPGDRFVSSPSFLKLSPLTYSVYCSMANRAENATNESRQLASFFNCINLYHFFLDEWPKYEYIAEGHPFVAYKVQGAALSLMQKPAPEIDAVFDLADSRIIPPQMLGINSDRDEFASFQDRLDNISKAFRLFGRSRLPNLIEASKLQYHKNARNYLWNQIGYSGQEGSKSAQPLRYDPAGSCSALQILLLGYRSPMGGYDLHPFLAEHSELVLRTLKHVLGSMNSTGSFPYGTPFSYKPNGMVGFTTSVNGLSAMSHFILKLLACARKAEYPARRFFESLLTENQKDFEKLFALASYFTSTVRTLTTSKTNENLLGHDLVLKGWSTDRAFDPGRIESWITIEVLRFAIHLRELLQEYLQFFVGSSLGATIPVGEPIWPYTGLADILHVEPDDSSSPILIDPDGKSGRTPGGGVAFEQEELINSPIPFLHSKFSKFMEKGMSANREWSQEVSSVLLFGPPGTAKSTTVKSLAQKLNWHFLEISPSDFIIDGLDRIEQNAKELFRKLSTLRETVILFDELDSLFVDRDFLAPESMINFIVPAMLPKLQGLNKRAKNQRLLIVVATNFYDRLDAAMVRLGRIDKHLLVLPYKKEARIDVLKTISPEIAGLDEGGLALVESGTQLFVFEELQQLARTVKMTDGKIDEFAPSSINPSWYLSRIPDENSSRKRTRGTTRLAVEVYEITGRLVNDPRTLTPSVTSETIVQALKRRASSLPKDEREWINLCESIVYSLENVR
ncbi:MAG: ATP-binding protein [Pyrinomonadaceae bacterium]